MSSILADPSEAWGPYKAQPSSDVLAKLARNSPYFKRNRPHVCSFYIKGLCKRGEECPYRHEKPADPEDPLSDQNIKDRYYGCNDPVAEKLLKRVEEIPKPTPPEDKSVSSIYLGNIGEEIDEQSLRNHFSQFGEIRNVVLVKKKNCAFLNFIKHESAKAAVEKHFQKCVIGNQKIVVKWGKPQAKRNLNAEGEELKPPIKLIPIPGIPSGETFDQMGFFHR